ncbi:NAD(P)-binding protein [Multifurca ochricompacta]|uniref:Probable quinone oxidoreductase n=1 Tax=Multifurca ochricompacta TaxID=376703 RepID=A0AAD4QRH6_9AGAM|nr:NAD(P)-binding protein [Multifurca ochricompacta]
MPYPTVIKGVGIKQNGGVEVIEELELPFPQVDPGDMLVKVQYAGVNFYDTYLRSGLYPTPYFPMPIAREVAGVLVELPTDEAILNSPNFKKRGFKKGGTVVLDVIGALKEYVSVPWDSMIYPVPDNVPASVAAASLGQMLTTLTQITDAYNVKEGDTVFVHTIAGGTGLLHAQLAKKRGAIVIGTTSTPQKAELAKAHGADHVILYKEEDTVERVSQLTGGKGVDVIYDGVGKDTFDNDFKMIKRRGTIVSFGNASGKVEPFSLTMLAEKNVRLLRPVYTNWMETVDERDGYAREVYRLVSTGEVKINIYKEHPFTAEGVSQAQLDLVGGKSTGKVLIKVADC